MNARKEETATELQSLDKRVMVGRFFGVFLIRGWKGELTRGACPGETGPQQQVYHPVE